MQPAGASTVSSVQCWLVKDYKQYRMLAADFDVVSNGM